MRQTQRFIVRLKLPSYLADGLAHCPPEIGQPGRVGFDRNINRDDYFLSESCRSPSVAPKSRPSTVTLAMRLPPVLLSAVLLRADLLHVHRPHGPLDGLLEAQLAGVGLDRLA